MKHSIRELDAGQLDIMWQCLQLQHKNTCTVEDVRALKTHLDIIRQALIQKNAGQRNDSGRESVLLEDLGTYVNLAVLGALQLYVYGGLDVLEAALEQGGQHGIHCDAETNSAY